MSSFSPDSPSASHVLPHTSPSRPTWIEIHLDALRHNARALYGALQTPLLAVIKANAYGHGAIPVAHALLDTTDAVGTPVVRLLGVASVDEGIVLREAGISAPILLLSAMLPEEAESAARHDLMPTLFTLDTARALNDAAQCLGHPARAHFKIDTGMGRLGVSPDAAGQLWGQIAALPYVKIEGIYTHFACADDDPDAMSGEQLRRFGAGVRACDVSRCNVVLHAANSAGALRYPAARFDLVRTGLALWGISPLGEMPLPDGAAHDVDLRPVMEWYSRITFVKDLKVGETVSYGATWRAARPSRIATVPVGYADGYPRRLGNHAHVLLRGHWVPVIGRITMDQLLLDVTDVSGAEIGERITIWGRDGATRLGVEEVATWAETIPYELLCAVGPRVPRLYTPVPHGEQEN